MPEARAIIEDASHNPATLKVLSQAFKLAWEEIGSELTQHPGAVAHARVRLAEIVIALSKGKRPDAANLAANAANIMRAAPGWKC